MELELVRVVTSGAQSTFPWTASFIKTKILIWRVNFKEIYQHHVDHGTNLLQFIMTRLSRCRLVTVVDKVQITENAHEPVPLHLPMKVWGRCPYINTPVSISKLGLDTNPIKIHSAKNNLISCRVTGTHCTWAKSPPSESDQYICWFDQL